jgi:arsenite/tail-anchored protein-transporting ATPase
VRGGGRQWTTTTNTQRLRDSSAQRSLTAFPRRVLSPRAAHRPICSDAFGQKFGRTPIAVEGFSNLFCMEIDPNVETDEAPDLGGQVRAGTRRRGALSDRRRATCNLWLFHLFMSGYMTPTTPPICHLPPQSAAPGAAGMLTGFLKEMGTNIPGIDELVSFTELMRHVQRMEFDVTVFDTAPTGHTLRLLSLPGMIDKLLTGVLGLRDKFGPSLNAMRGIMGGAASGLPSEDDILGKLDEFKGA